MLLLSAWVKLIPPSTIEIEESNMPVMGLAGMGKQVEVQRR